MENEAKVSNYLGVDYGRAKVGLSVASGETRLAFSYGTLKNDKHFFQNLLDIIKKEEISAVIIGVPAYINDEEVEYDGEKLGEYLRNVSKIPVYYANEMFTTKMAEENLREKGGKRANRSDHEEAARIILQSWLDNNQD